MIGLPVLFTSVQVSVTWPLPGDGITFVGAARVVGDNVTGAEAAEAGPVPALLLAVTVNV